QADKTFFTDALRRFREIFSGVFAQDNVILLGRNLGFLQRQRFRRAFEANAKSVQEKSLALRLNTLTWAAEHCASVAGDFVECGVWRGFCMSVVADYMNFGVLPKR